MFSLIKYCILFGKLILWRRIVRILKWTQASLLLHTFYFHGWMKRDNIHKYTYEIRPQFWLQYWDKLYIIKSDEITSVHCKRLLFKVFFFQRNSCTKYVPYLWINNDFPYLHIRVLNQEYLQYHKNKFEQMIRNIA